VKGGPRLLATRHRPLPPALVMHRSPMRLLCLYVPDFPLAALLRARPDLCGGALAVSDAPGARARVLAVSPEAARNGVVAGLTVAQAQARLAHLAVEVLSADLTRAAQAALCDVAESFSPRVEDADAGIAYLDASGLGSMFADELKLAQAAVRRAEALALPAHVGVAGSKTAAYLAARDGGGVAVLPAGEEWSFLAPVGIDLLGPSPDLAATLRRWGIRTVGDLVQLPAAAVATRLGPEGARLAALARGDDRHPLQPRSLPLHFEEGIEIDYGIETVEPFLFLLRGLLDRLLARLEVRGLVCGDLRLSLQLAHRGRDERTLTVAAPSNDRKALLALVRVHLEAHPPVAAIEGVRLHALPERLRPAQLDLFRPSGPAPARLATTLAQLSALCGADRVGRPVVSSDHRPEDYAVAEFRVGEPAAVFAATACASLALRAFRPPREVEVLCARDRPQLVRGESISGRVVQAAGPWRRQGHWWDETRYARDYYDAQLSDGGVYRIYRELETAKWFIEGAYD